jgi:hypothetical protein
MKLSKKPVSDDELFGKTATKRQRTGEVTPVLGDWAALLRSLQERGRILRRRALLVSQLEQLQVVRASAAIQAAADHDRK